VLSDVSDTVVAVVIPEGAHHLDLMFSHPDDPPSVEAARRREMAHVRAWIAEARAARAAAAARRAAAAAAAGGEGAGAGGGPAPAAAGGGARWWARAWAAAGAQLRRR
jgi:hypothetical protein